ncbi:MAG TPA: hypothetical protein VIT45_00340 [Allosphingosinicella sp.]
MPTLLLNRPIAFPVALLSAALRGRFPTAGWRVGEEDFGARKDLVSLDRPQVIMGRAGEEMLLVSVELVDEPYRPPNGHRPPEHRLHARISRPSTDNDSVARRIALIVGSTLAADQDPGARLQLEPGGNWLDGPDMLALLNSLDDDPDLSRRSLVGLPERFDAEPAADPSPAPAEAAPGQAEPASSGEEKTPRPRLGSFTILLDGEVFIDWPKIDEVMRKIDPQGGWQSVATPGGMGMIIGRATIMAIWSPIPMEQAAIDNGLLRSFWFDGDRARVARHRQYIALSIESPDDYRSRLMTAKIATLIVGVLAGLPQACAVFNNGVGTIFSPEMARGQVGILHTGELPIQLWAWTAPNSIEDGNVCLTTGGFLPLLGFEIEVWNAPHPVAYVSEKLSRTLRYLLLNGPIINHGDSIGTEPGDRSIRCFFGDSRVERPEPTKAMFLEFDSEVAAARPRKDLPLPPSIRPAADSPVPRRAGGFGRKGL